MWIDKELEQGNDNLQESLKKKKMEVNYPLHFRHNTAKRVVAPAHRSPGYEYDT